MTRGAKVVNEVCNGSRRAAAAAKTRKKMLYLSPASTLPAVKYTSRALPPTLIGYANVLATAMVSCTVSKEVLKLSTAMYGDQSARELNPNPAMPTANSNMIPT
jgi:hypothetical protein